MDLLHFIEIFLARRSNQVPSFWPPEARELKVLDFCRLLISRAVVMAEENWLLRRHGSHWTRRCGGSGSRFFIASMTTVLASLSQISGMRGKGRRYHIQIVAILSPSPSLPPPPTKYTINTVFVLFDQLYTKDQLSLHSE
jgi:hypothetical protein